MHAGVTGTRDLPSYAQERVLRNLLKHVDELTHGGCIGVDAIAHWMATVNDTPVNVRRGDTPDYWANLDESNGLVQFMTPTTNKKRNQMIVETVDYLIAVPAHAEDHRSSARSGTWQTVRMARKLELPVTIIRRDGSYKDERVPLGFLSG